MGLRGLAAASQKGLGAAKGGPEAAGPAQPSGAVAGAGTGEARREPQQAAASTVVPSELAAGKPQPSSSGKGAPAGPGQPGPASVAADQSRGSGPPGAPAPGTDGIAAQAAAGSATIAAVPTGVDPAAGSRQPASIPIGTAPVRASPVMGSAPAAGPGQPSPVAEGPAPTAVPAPRGAEPAPGRMQLPDGTPSGPAPAVVPEPAGAEAAAGPRAANPQKAVAAGAAPRSAAAGAASVAAGKPEAGLRKPAADVTKNTAPVLAGAYGKSAGVSSARGPAPAPAAAGANGKQPPPGPSADQLGAAPSSSLGGRSPAPASPPVNLHGNAAFEADGPDESPTDTGKVPLQSNPVFREDPIPEGVSASMPATDSRDASKGEPSGRSHGSSSQGGNSQAMDLFTALHDYISGGGGRTLEALFKQFDKDGSGKLSVEELALLIQSLAPGLTDRDVLHFYVRYLGPSALPALSNAFLSAGVWNPYMSLIYRDLLIC